METQAMTIRIPEDLYEQLRRAAFEARAPMNTLVVEGIDLRLARSDREEHWEVAIQAGPGGDFYAYADPRGRYPDPVSAGQAALKVQGHFHCVRVRHVITEWLMPDEAAAEGVR